MMDETDWLEGAYNMYPKLRPATAPGTRCPPPRVYLEVDSVLGGDIECTRHA